MTAIAKHPKLDGSFEYTQLYGFSMGLRFQAIISGVNNSGDIVGQCLEALAADTIVCGNVVSGHPNLYVQGISIRSANGNVDMYEADITCVPLREMEDRWSLEVSTQQEQITSLKDGFGNLLWAGYTYPIGYYDSDLEGKTVTQGAPLPRMVANYNFKLKGIKKTADPLMWAAQFQDHVNSTIFLGCGSGVLLCNNCRYYEYAIDKDGASHYMFEFSFLSDFNQHQTEFTFVDKDGQVPPDLVYGFGIRHAIFYPYADFNLITK